MDDRKLLHMLSAGPRAGAELAAALAVAPEALAQACARLQAAGAALVASADGTWQLLQPLDLQPWRIAAGEAWLAVTAVAVGLLAAALPAVRAYRTDIAATLARP